MLNGHTQTADRYERFRGGKHGFKVVQRGVKGYGHVPVTEFGLLTLAAEEAKQFAVMTGLFHVSFL